jgi:hypothetical protein
MATPCYEDLLAMAQLTIRMRHQQRRFFSAAPGSVAKQAALQQARDFERQLDRLTAKLFPDDVLGPEEPGLAL